MLYLVAGTLYLAGGFVVDMLMNTDKDSLLLIFTIIFTIPVFISGARLYWRLYSKSGAVVRIIIGTNPLINLPYY